jgi:hypothetical protein
MTHIPAPCDQLHDTASDVTTAHEPTPAQREVLTLLDLGNGGRLVRLTVQQWRQVNAVVARLAEARDAGICGDETPRVVAGPPLLCELRAGHRGWHEAPEYDRHGHPLGPARWTRRNDTHAPASKESP